MEKTCKEVKRRGGDKVIDKKGENNKKGEERRTR